MQFVGNFQESSGVKTGWGAGQYYINKWRFTLYVLLLAIFLSLLAIPYYFSCSYGIWNNSPHCCWYHTPCLYYNLVLNVSLKFICDFMCFWETWNLFICAVSYSLLFFYMKSTSSQEWVLPKLNPREDESAWSIISLTRFDVYFVCTTCTSYADSNWWKDWSSELLQRHPSLTWLYYY